MQGRILRSSSLRRSDPRLNRAICETLEQRQLLSYTPSVSGNSSVNEGSNYSLNLTWGGSPASSFVIDWGDGTNADLITGASSAAHVYDDNGPGGAPYSIRAGAAVASPSGDVSGPHISVTASGKYLTLTETSGGVAINRFLADGSVDTSFGSGGSTFLGGSLWAPYTFIRAVPAAAGGGFIVGGSDTEWENYGLKVWRFTDSGSLDTTYGTNGVSESGRFTDGYSIDGASDLPCSRTARWLRPMRRWCLSMA